MQDDFASYVVCLVGSGDPEPLAHFLGRGGADGYARDRINTRGIERAHIFGVGATATRAALTGVLHGEAELVETVVSGTLQAQAEPDFKHVWERAREGGTEAIRKFLGR